MAEQLFTLKWVVLENGKFEHYKRDAVASWQVLPDRISITRDKTSVMSEYWVEIKGQLVSISAWSEDWL